MKASNVPPINYIPKISMEKLLQTASTLRVFTERVCIFLIYERDFCGVRFFIVKTLQLKQENSNYTTKINSSAAHCSFEKK